MINVDEEEIRVCAECHEEPEVVSSGDESWVTCENCGTVEGETVYITIKEYEAR